MTNETIEQNIKNLLKSIGENPEREGLKRTPERVSVMYNEIFKGYDSSKKPVIVTFSNGKDGIFYDQLITDRGTFYSHCEHHMVPFFGEYVFGYIPDKKILGLSKVGRVVEYFSSKLQIQERLVKEIADELEQAVQPKGLAIFIRATHLCKVMRGIRKNGEMTTCDLRGIFKKDSTAKEEFLREVYR